MRKVYQMPLDGLMILWLPNGEMAHISYNTSSQKIESYNTSSQKIELVADDDGVIEQVSSRIKRQANFHVNSGKPLSRMD